MPSIKDVAIRAGVSYTTVSHVINKTRHVNQNTIERVEDAIKELGYVPSQTARNLRKGRSNTIGVIDTSTNDFFFLEVMRFAQLEFEAHNINLYYSFCAISEDKILSSYEINMAKEFEYIEQLIMQNVEAIIFNPINPDKELKTAVSKYDLPFISFQREIDTKNCYSVMSDDYMGGYLAANHLITLGHRKIAVVYGFAYPTHSARNRRKGIEKAFREANIKESENYWQMNCYQTKESYVQTQYLLSLDKPPTAIIYYSDNMALAGIQAIHNKGLKIPKDISVIGYDNIQMADFSIPGLTTINQDKMILGKAIAEKALWHIEKKGICSDKDLLPVELIVRESTAPPKKQSG